LEKVDERFVFVFVVLIRVSSSLPDVSKVKTRMMRRRFIPAWNTFVDQAASLSAKHLEL
jgi:hypothetical protein